MFLYLTDVPEQNLFTNNYLHDFATLYDELLPSSLLKYHRITSLKGKNDVQKIDACSHVKRELLRTIEAHHMSTVPDLIRVPMPSIVNYIMQ